LRICLLTGLLVDVRLRDAGARVSRLEHLDWLLFVRGVQGGRLCGPSRVGLGCERLHLRLAKDFSLLLGDGGRFEARVSEPLHPLRWNGSALELALGGEEERTRDVDVAVVGPSGVLDYATVAMGVDGVLEFPVRVALEIEAWRKPPSARRLEESTAKSANGVPTSHFRRQGSCIVFQLYHSLRRGPGCAAMGVGIRARWSTHA